MLRLVTPAKRPFLGRIEDFIPRGVDEPSVGKQLLTEFQILHLIYYRSINQHRVAVWWKYLEMLHRHLRKVVVDPTNQYEIRYIKQRLLRKCYYEFNGIIALGQFINLGFTLVGLISRVGDLLDKMEDLSGLRPTKKAKLAPPAVEASSEPVEAPEPVYDVMKDDIIPAKRKKSKKKKKSKSAMDDIFGF